MPGSMKPTGASARRKAGAGLVAVVTRRVVSSDENGMRLDRWFRAHYPQVTFAYLNKLARTGQLSTRCKAVGVYRVDVCS